MNLWRIFILILFTGCVSKDIKELPICDNAFLIVMPGDLKEFEKKRMVFGDDLLCSKNFSNEDSTVTVHVDLYNDVSRRSLTSSVSNQIDALEHLNPDLVVLKKEVIKQHGIEMLSIVYELPYMQLSHGSIVEHSMFFTLKGRAVVDVTCIFKNEKEKEAAVKLAGLISNSIKIRSKK